MKLLSVFFFSLLVPVYGVAQMPPVVKEGQTIKLSGHVFVIPDELRPMVPNVGIVVGTRATLIVAPGLGARGGGAGVGRRATRIVDPGLGARSVEAAMRESAKLSRNRELYLVTTHFHPEHTTGEAGLPSTAKLIRPKAQRSEEQRP